MLEESLTQPPPLSPMKSEPSEKCGLGAAGRMTGCEEIMGDLSLFDDGMMRIGQTWHRYARGGLGSGPKAGGGMRRFEAAS